MMFVAALLGLGLLLAFGHWRAVAFRWLRRAVLAAAGLSAWLALGTRYPAIGYLGYTFPFGAAAWFLRGRILARLPRLAELLRWVPTTKRREFDRAFKDEVDDEGQPRIPVVTRYEKVDEDA